LNFEKTKKLVEEVYKDSLDKMEMSSCFVKAFKATEKSSPDKYYMRDYFLEKGADINEAFDGDYSIITDVMRNYRSDSLEYISKRNLDYLLDNKADINTRIGHKSPLTSAVRKGNISLIKYLLDKGAFVDGHCEVNSTTGDTIYLVNPLHAAGYFYDENEEKALEISKLLLDYGANPNAGSNLKLRSLRKATPIFYASLHSLKNVKYLIKRGARIDFYDDHLSLPIHFAASYDAFNSVRFYIEEMGVDPDIKTKNEEKRFQMSPLDYILYRFDRHNATASERAAFMDIVKYLVKKGADVNTKKYRFEEQIVQAVYYDSTLTLLKLMSENSAKPEKINLAFKRVLEEYKDSKNILNNALTFIDTTKVEIVNKKQLLELYKNQISE
jgi:ankyrin repeat protein